MSKEKIQEVKYILECKLNRKFEINVGKTNLIWKKGQLINGQDIFKDGIPESIFKRYFQNHLDYFSIKKAINGDKK